jgi:hypothetical protein
MPINVDEAFLTRLANVMRDLAGQAPTASGGEIDNMNLRLGHNNFFAGQQLAGVLHRRGGEIQQRLTELGETAGNRSVELKLFLEMTGGTEDLNKLEAGSFGDQLPSWAPGAASSGGSSSGGSGSGGSSSGTGV